MNETVKLANGVEIEYDDTASKEADYQFTKDVPEIGDVAKKGVRFYLESRTDPDGTEGFLYSFKTENGDEFKLSETDFQFHIAQEEIVKLQI